ncbi:MAG: hypothetical protein ACLP5H_15915 [Desulfomonilaceae bacterium]
MDEETSEVLYTVILTRVQDEEAKKKVAETLSRVTTNLPADTALKRMESLPWALTRRATAKNAERLARVMERLGATVQVSPSPPEGTPLESARTQVLPGAAFIPGSQTEVSDELSRTLGDSTVAPPAPSEQVEVQPSPAPPSALPRQPPPPQPNATDGSGPTGGDGLSIEPLSFGGILDRTFQICRQHFWKLFAIVGIPYLVTACLVLAVSIVTAVVGFSLQAVGDVPIWVLITAAVTVIPSVIVAIIAVFYLSQGALIHAVSAVHLGRDMSVRNAYRFVLARLGKFVLTSVLFVIVIFAAFLIAVLFGVVLFFISRDVFSSGWWSAITWLPLALIPFYTSIKLVLFDKIVIIEDIAYTNALKRSWDLLTGKADGGWPRGYLLRLLILLFLFGLISITIAMVFQIPASIIAALMPASWIVGSVVQHLLSNIGGLIGGIFGGVCLVVFYYDIRSRKEGFDLKMLAQQHE